MKTKKDVEERKIPALDKSIDDMEVEREFPLEHAFGYLDDFMHFIDNATDVYDGFAVTVLNYVKKKASRLQVIKKFLDNNPDAKLSDIHDYILTQDDFYEDGTCGDSEKEE